MIQSDIIKIGRILFKLRNIELISEKPPPNASVDPKKQKENIEITSDAQIPGKLCKICLSGSESTDNPLVSPCKCDGSMKFVHFECLQKWAWNKINLIRKINVQIINLEEVKCELCLSEIEGYFSKITNKKQNIWNSK